MCTYHINISIENFQYKQDEVENKLISVIFAGKNVPFTCQTCYRNTLKNTPKLGFDFHFSQILTLVLGLTKGVYLYNWMNQIFDK